MAFKHPDYYAIDELLTEEERLVRQTVADFVDTEVLPIIEENAREGTFPMHLVEKIGDLGLFGITLPQEYGCAGLNNTCAMAWQCKSSSAATPEFARLRRYRAPS